MKPLVSIIIVKYQSESYLEQCLKSIGSQGQQEIIIIDNDQKNIGFSAGCNQGAKKAKGKYLFFLNPDTVVQPGAIKTLAEFLDQHDKAGIAAPLLLDKNKKPYQKQGTGELTPLAALFSFSWLVKFWPKNPWANRYWLADWNKKTAKEVAVAPGSALMIRKDVFEKIKGFDENFFLYFEESDLCRRARQAGWQVFFQPKAKVIHFWGKSTGRVFQQSRFYYFKKYYGWLTAFLLEIFLRPFEK